MYYADAQPLEGFSFFTHLGFRSPENGPFHRWGHGTSRSTAPIEFATHDSVRAWGRLLISMRLITDPRLQTKEVFSPEQTMRMVQAMYHLMP